MPALLFATVEKWLKEQGMEEVQGPLGFSNLDHQGLLIEGHDWLPSIASDYHWDYYQNYFEAAGYEKEIDWLEFRITFPDALPEKSFKVAEMIMGRYGLRPVNFTSSKEIEPYKQEVFDLFNQAFANLFGTFALPVITSYSIHYTKLYDNNRVNSFIVTLTYRLNIFSRSCTTLDLKDPNPGYQHFIHKMNGF